MEAIILAGGLGTRLKSVVADVPKPMANIKGKPFLQYVIDWLDKQGINDIILSIGYKSEIIKEYFGNTVRYSYEDEPLGTGGAMKKALALCKNDHIIIVNGDTLFNVEIEINKEFELIIFCRHVINTSRYGFIEINDNNIINAIHEKKKNTEGYINGGVYIIQRNLLDNYPDRFSFETFALPKIIKEKNVYAIKSDSYFIDIGIPEDYEKAKNEL